MHTHVRRDLSHTGADHVGMLLACVFAPAGYAAQSLLAAIGCIQFVSNVFFASWVLKEQVGTALAAFELLAIQRCRMSCTSNSSRSS